MPQPDWEADPAGFRALVEEIIDAGFIPTVAFNGDNGDNPTDGYPNALRQLYLLETILDSLHDRVLYARFYDGVFYGSDPSNIQHFGQEFTRVIRKGGSAPGYLAIEFQPGRIPVGGGHADFLSGGRMTDYDYLGGEFACPVADPSLSRDRNGPGSVYNPEAGHRESAYEQAMGNVWEVGKRLAGAAYMRPADQPGDNDAGLMVPSYLDGGSSRGPYFWGVMETGGGGKVQPGVYEWVRGTCTVADLQVVGNYFRALGAPLVCLP